MAARSEARTAMSGTPGANPKPATAARIYDYYLGGIHNFAADQAAAKALLAAAPSMAMIARGNRAFLGRAVKYLANAGVRQFLDIGSGIPTEGNVHEIAQDVAPDARVVYVDIDPVAVAESLELLEGNQGATAVRGDLRAPQAILDHPQVRKMFDFDKPIGVLLVGVLYFVPDDAEAYGAVNQLLAACAPGSHLVVSHGTVDDQVYDENALRSTQDIYRRQTATPLTVRTRAGIARFFDGLELVDPGLVWLPEWRPEPTDPPDFGDEPQSSWMLVGVGRLG
jgi:hypothetical protein